MLAALRRDYWIPCLWLALSFLNSCQSDQDPTPGKQDIRLNFFPINEEHSWQAQLVSGEAEVGPSSRTGYAYTTEIIKDEDSPATIKFVSENRESFAYVIDGDSKDLYFYQASPQVFTTAPPVLPDQKNMVVYFIDDNQDRLGWGLHLWDEQGIEWTSWNQPLTLKNFENQEGLHFLYAEVPLPPSDLYAARPPQYEEFPPKMGIIVHRGDEKSVDDNQYLYPKQQGRMVFLKRGDSTIYCAPDQSLCPSTIFVDGAAVHWVEPATLLWQGPQNEDYQYELVFSPSATLVQNGQYTSSSDAQVIPLTPTNETYDSSLFPHLRGWPKFQVNASPVVIDEAIRSQLYAVIKNKSGKLIALTQVQIPGLLDQLYAYQGPLGLDLAQNQPSINLWSPTAKQVTLKLSTDAKNTLLSLPMKRLSSGVWTIEGDKEWVDKNYYYRYEIKVYHYLSDKVETFEVTDPYSVSLATNSSWSQIVDLESEELKPIGWDQLKKEPVSPQDISILEVHIRDFSIFDDLVPPSDRGKYVAFGSTPIHTESTDTHGQAYLKSLVDAGLTHVQVLPANDFVTVLENPSQRVDIEDPFENLCIRSFAPQELCDQYGLQSIEHVYLSLPKNTGVIQDYQRYVRPVDGFNWGYDPFHYGVPEGSYATDAQGPRRILEFRHMVQDLARLGLRISLDVVYNHMFTSGLYPEAVLDRTVPGYYHRRHPITGLVENSTCCANTASEHLMMERLMIDTLQRWRDQYKIDAFRFDLMAHHMKANLLKAQKVLGSDVFLYGEGWNFGEVANNQRGIHASQLNMSGTGIASFNDRFRDAVRGGGAFDCGILLFQQGYGNGLFVDTNQVGGLLKAKVENANCAKPEDFEPLAKPVLKDAYLAITDRVRIGLIGTLKDYVLFTKDNVALPASQIDYFGLPTGYTSAPTESINYISKHDNQTLWDINQIKLPITLPLSERLKIQEFGISLNLLAQGVPFFQLGVDLLRSKSLNRDSYDAGDWFNRVDYTGQTHNWNIGLPQQDKDGINWPFFVELNEKISRPSQEEILSMRERFRTWLAIRYSSPLFRLETANDVMERVKFLNTGAQSDERSGIIIMKINDDRCRFEQDLDPMRHSVVAIFNPKPYDIQVEAQGYRVHGLLEYLIPNNGVIFTIPSRSTGVLEQEQNKSCGGDHEVRLLIP